MIDYSGSLVNIVTAHAFLETMAAKDHTGVIVTVGASATGLAIAALARQKRVPSSSWFTLSTHASSFERCISNTCCSQATMTSTQSSSSLQRS